jgi:hypothetical protein
MELGGTPTTPPSAPQAIPTAQPNAPIKETVAAHQLGEIPKPTEQPKNSRLLGGLGNPKMSKESKLVLEKLKAEKPFKIAAETYGKAIAESILLQTTGTPTARMNFDEGLTRTVEFKGGSYALIYKGKTPLRVTPFMWQLDQGTRRLWAVFTFNNFYGHNLPHPLKSPMGWFRQKISIPLVLTPFDNSSNMVEDYGKGYLMKVDERTQFQVPMNVQDDKEAEQMRVDNKHFISAGLTLWMDLLAATKNRVNMRMIAYLLIGLAIVGFAIYFIHSHPGFLSGIIPKI